MTCRLRLYGLLAITCCFLPARFAPAAEPIAIGDRLELLVDDYLVDSLQGDIQRVMIRPEPKEVVFTADEAWEGNTSGYYTVFQDGDLYRMIYRGWQHGDKDDVAAGDRRKAAHPETTCYAESKDGVHWTKPDLGLFEYAGSKQNNIVWLGPGSHNFTAFRDDNPAAPASARYKALGRGPGGLFAFESPDCIHWKQIGEKAVITHGAFDSQNLAFWDQDRKEYRAYWRFFGQGVRKIRTAVSKNFVDWDQEADLSYTPADEGEHLYTNAIQKYARAPHLFVGFPTRFEKKSEQVEPILIVSRDGENFTRYAEPVIPRTAPQDRNHNRSNYMVWGILQLPGKPGELSVYGTENYYESTPGRLRQFVYRVDGFVALRGGSKGGQATSRLLTQSGDKLVLNYQAKQGGSLTVEVLDAAGKVVGKSQPLTGDATAATVVWQQQPKLGQGALQLRFHLQDADLYSFRFQ
ncbi:glycoside hydrolase family protein [Lignipirellula cremea]|uniref:Glycosyl hydrolase family 32 N-terminal domain-containing protein n=1 Tax=Lignipirellula cremea TaxID=2528010 RepID=A0A518DUT0_9BACT|nr:hypothetical protein [Lignipirellula cremea]QDU95593.1 hypothetical protein Pla8534_34090 [Lignipirellula cremea]